METKRPLPFDCVIFDMSPIRVTNRYSGKSCLLEPDAIAVYDVIKGAELTENYALMNKGLEWFCKYFPKEYYILLD